MKRPVPYLFVLVLAAAVLLSACDDGFSFGDVRGSGNVTVESREVSGFDEIAVLGSGEIAVDVTGTESLTIEAEDNILPLLTTEVTGGRLELSTESSISPTRPIKYTITAASLNAISISGSGNVTANGLEATDFDLTIAGSGELTPAGTADDLSVVISGSGRYDGEDLVATAANVIVSGSGNVLVNATERLDVDISGSGNVSYMGNPTVTQSVSGSGAVTRG